MINNNKINNIQQIEFTQRKYFFFLHFYETYLGRMQTICALKQKTVS